MGHAEHGGFHPGLGGLVHDRVQQGDGRLGPLQTEALLADVLGLQELLQGLGRAQPFEDPALLFGVTWMETPSTCSWIHRFWSGSWMCMYSTPTVWQ